MQVADSLPIDNPAARQAPASLLARLAKSIPLPRGPQWYLVAYRWLLIAACLYTVVVTWNMWQVRSDPNWRAWSFATPANQSLWEHRPTDAQLAPMLPVWDWLPQFPVAWLLIGSLLTILIFPRVGLTALFVTMVVAVLMDQTRLQPHYLMAFLIMATLPGPNAQLIGRVGLASLWFWAGFHKFIIDFIKPADASGFATDVIPRDLADHFFPVDAYHWDLHTIGAVLGWAIALTEMSLGIGCFIPRLRWFVAIVAALVHAGIIRWNCWVPGPRPFFAWPSELALHSNLIPWNFVLAVAGFALILPWRNRWATWRGSHPLVRGVAFVMLAYPATFYLNWVNAYLSYCIYVPNNACGELHRPGEGKRPISNVCYDVLNFPLSPGQTMNELYFDKFKQPGDTLVIYDPRPWAQSRGLNKRELWYDGEKRNGEYYGHWVNHDARGHVFSEGDMIDGKESGHWVYWYPDGKKVMEGNFVKGKPDGVWKWWMPDGEERRIEYDHGELVTPAVKPEEP